MSQAAYEANGQLVSSDTFYRIACDPQRSVVVEACAGAGKTWMLVSRILRALLDGVPPNQILAITFTKKAAGEMRERLHTWMRDFALCDDATREDALRMRGVPADRVAELVPRLQALYAQWLDDGRGVDIHTIHGWFSRLVKAAPLDVLHELQLPPELNLVEDSSEHWPALWGRFLRRIDASAPKQAGQATRGHDGVSSEDAHAPHLAFLAVVQAVGRASTEAWLARALNNRLELQLTDQAGHLLDGVASAGQWSELWAGLAQPEEALARASVDAHFRALARQLVQAKGSIPQKAGEAVAQALALADLAARAQALCKALLTDDGAPRKRMGEGDDLQWAQAWLQDLQQARAQQEAHELHGHMVSLSRLLFDEYARFKAERGLADMVDLELAAARLLRDPVLSGWVQERLDSQVRHLLMDEFQDTSPLQWQTLKSWLGAYAGAGGGHSGRQPIKVFLVGDPKQSIYRFRRADPRVFGAAKDFVLQALEGDLLACDHTRRNAPGIIDALNLVMGEAAAQGDFPGFRPHTTDAKVDATLRVLPSAPTQASTSSDAQPHWRDSLLTPREQALTVVKEAEAVQVAQAVAALLANGDLQPSDIFVLSRKRAMLSLVAQALDARGVPHVAPEDTLLIDTPEVRDLVAVIDVLVSPHHDLALAHALKSPLFGASDDDLLWLAGQARDRAGGGWWPTLLAQGQAEDCPQALRRAAGLLLGWHDLARMAPPHDLLERVVTEGDYRVRLQACVPAGQRAQALAHVDALLAQSLEMDAGRDATPYRWVRALKRLPLSLPPRAHPDAVQLLTIHGAKGLEAEVVFMVDTDPAGARKDSYALLVDWPEGAPQPLRCAFVRSQSKPPPSLAAFLEGERAADQREELNALYVALTRARRQLVFSRTQPRSQAAGSWWQRLRDCGVIDLDQAWQVPEPAPASAPAVDQRATVDCRVLPSLQARADTAGDTLRDADAPKATLPLAAPGSGEQERLLGQVVHKALEWLTTLPLAQRTSERLDRAVAGAAQAHGLEATLVPQALQLVGHILHAPALQPWLDPAQLAWAGNEVALIDQGQVLRIDRLVAVARDGQRDWWVLDYKLQHRPQALPAYRAQLQRYVAAVAALQPGQVVRAAFITGAGEWVPLD